MYCTNCGAELPDDARFCPHCGAPTGVGEEPRADADPASGEGCSAEPEQRESAGTDPLTAMVTRFQQKKDQDAFQDIFNRTYKKYYGSVYNKTHDAALTEDILQDSYLDCYTKIGQLRDPSKFNSWMLSILSSHISHSYTNKFAAHEMQDLVTEDDEGEESSWLEGQEDDSELRLPENYSENKELQRLLLQSMDTLSPEQRQAISLYYFDQVPQKDIAEIMGVPENTVKTYLSRGKKKLNKDVSRYANQYGLKLLPVAAIPFAAWLFGQDVQAAEIQAPSSAGKVFSGIERGIAVKAADGALAGAGSAAGNSAAHGSGTGQKPVGTATANNSSGGQKPAGTSAVHNTAGQKGPNAQNETAWKKTSQESVTAPKESSGGAETSWGTIENKPDADVGLGSTVVKETAVRAGGHLTAKVAAGIIAGAVAGGIGVGAVTGYQGRNNTPEAAAAAVTEASTESDTVPAGLAAAPSSTGTETGAAGEDGWKDLPIPTGGQYAYAFSMSDRTDLPLSYYLLQSGMESTPESITMQGNRPYETDTHEFTYTVSRDEDGLITKISQSVDGEPATEREYQYDRNPNDDVVEGDLALDEENRPISGGPASIEYKYNPDGTLESIAIDDDIGAGSPTYTFEYDDLGRIFSRTVSYQNIAYSEDGSETAKEDPDFGDVVSYEDMLIIYADDSGRIQTIQTMDSDGDIIGDQDCDYDDNGNVSAIMVYGITDKNDDTTSYEGEWYLTWPEEAEETEEAGSEVTDEVDDLPDNESEDRPDVSGTDAPDEDVQDVPGTSGEAAESTDGSDVSEDGSDSAAEVDTGSASGRTGRQRKDSSSLRDFIGNIIHPEKKENKALETYMGKSLSTVEKEFPDLQKETDSTFGLSEVTTYVSPDETYGFAATSGNKINIVSIGWSDKAGDADRKTLFGCTIDSTPEDVDQNLTDAGWSQEKEGEYIKSGAMILVRFEDNHISEMEYTTSRALIFAESMVN